MIPCRLQASVQSHDMSVPRLTEGWCWSQMEVSIFQVSGMAMEETTVPLFQRGFTTLPTPLLC